MHLCFSASQQLEERVPFSKKSKKGKENLKKILTVSCYYEEFKTKKFTEKINRYLLPTNIDILNG